MVYEKYSKNHFAALGLNTDAARDLANSLEADVLRELHAIVESAFLEIIERLNREGHGLQPYGEILPGDLPFRDSGGLRLAADIVISAGYAHTYEEET